MSESQASGDAFAVLQSGEKVKIGVVEDFRVSGARIWSDIPIYEVKSTTEVIHFTAKRTISANLSTVILDIGPSKRSRENSRRRRDLGRAKRRK